MASWFFTFIIGVHARLLEESFSDSYNVNDTFNSCKETIAGVPQGSIRRPLLFNICVNDVFLFENKAFPSNYADNNVLYTSGSKFEEVKTHLKVH